MPVHSGELRFSTDGDGDVVDLTDGLLEVVRASGLREGVVSVFVPGLISRWAMNARITTGRIGKAALLKKRLN